MVALVVSVGGTPEPLIKSICERKPEFVIFYASQETVVKVENVIDGLDKQNLKIRYKTILVNDANDLNECYDKALEIHPTIVEFGIPATDVIVDYTGGTKNMTAALCMATINNGYRYSYVGGTERSKQGTGVVLDGFEKVFEAPLPWQQYLLVEQQRLALYFNNYLFAAAKTIANRLATTLREPDRFLYQAMAKIIEGYALWDRFQYWDAVEFLQVGLKDFKIRSQYDEHNKPILDKFTAQIGKNLGFLKRICPEKQGVDKVTSDFSLLHIVDMLANAERRYEENKFDDAIIRLYRSLEMVGQVAFEKQFECSPGDVNSARLPDSVQVWLPKYRNERDGKIKLPLYALFSALKAAESKVAAQFFSNEKKILDLITARDHSILAHGVNIIKQSSFEEMDKILRNTFEINETIEFPKLSW
jgi:CRISPR-associated protein (TIGR02710 family)